MPSEAWAEPGPSKNVAPGVHARVTLTTVARCYLALAMHRLDEDPPAGPVRGSCGLFMKGKSFETPGKDYRQESSTPQPGDDLRRTPNR